ncbi:unnamed protein product, partial [Brassica oleracea]
SSLQINSLFPNTLVFHARTCNRIAFPLFSSHLCNSPVRFMSLSSSVVV